MQWYLSRSCCEIRLCRCSQHPGGQSWAPDPLGAGDWVSSRIPAHEAPPANKLETAGTNKQDTLPGPSPSGFSGLGSPPLPSAPSSAVPLLLKNKSVPAVAAQTADARSCLACRHFCAPAPPSLAPGSQRALPTGTPKGRPSWESRSFPSALLSASSSWLSFPRAV